MKEFNKSIKLEHVAYDIRGPVLEEAMRMRANGEKILRLNTGNPAEFGFTAPDEVIHDLIMNARDSEGYSDSKGIFSARKAIMQYCQLKNFPNVGIDDIYLGNGVSELIVMSMQGLLDNGDEVLVPMPDYPLWTAAVSLAGGNAVHYICDEEAEWYPDLDDIKSKISSNTKAIVLINPNNPTGISIDREFLFRVLRVCREMDILLVVDECFLDFMEEPGRYTLKAQLSRYHNLFLLKAFTKRYAMAGIRLGYGITENTELLDAMTQVTQPWNISVMAQAAGIAALKETAYVEEGRQMVFREAKYLKEELQRLGMEVFPSEANYIFFHGPENLFEICVEQGVLIRDCSNYSGLRKGYYRVAVRTHEENQELIRAMRDGTTKAAVAHAEVLKEEEQA